MYKEEAFLHALSKLASLKDLTVYGKPLTFARLPTYNPTPTAPTSYTDTEVSSISSTSDMHEEDSSVDVDDVDRDNPPSSHTDAEQVHVNIPQPSSQPGVSVSTTSHSGSTSSLPAVSDAASESLGAEVYDDQDLGPIPETLNNSPISAWNFLDAFGPPSSPGADGEAPNTSANDVVMGNNSHPQLAGWNHAPPLPQPSAQTTPVTNDAHQPGPPPQNANGGPGINITFDFSAKLSFNRFTL
jgi:hypothetical protein